MALSPDMYSLFNHVAELRITVAYWTMYHFGDGLNGLNVIRGVIRRSITIYMNFWRKATDAFFITSNAMTIH